jgi:IS30 family transposase
MSALGGEFNRSLQHQRGSNENTNCLQRRYFLKGTDPPALFAGVPSQIRPVVHQHPRKTLGFEPTCQLAASGVLQ